MLKVWLRVIRIKFLFASIIAVSVGLAINWNHNHSIELLSASLTFVGVMALHASVDLLNDYWDFKRGIDTITKRTKMSGGTGVLPDGLLSPSSVYRAGIAFLIIGGTIGAYFIITNGITIAVILTFAILSIYFYSTKIVDSGLAEIFVTIKGIMIVLGTYFIQSNQISLDVILSGMIVGIMSSLVLFIASFPDYDADRSKGRKTLVIAIGKKNATHLFWIFPILSLSIISLGAVLEIFPTSVLLSILPIPLIIQAGMGLKKNYDKTELLLPYMTKTLMFSRISGILFVVGISLEMSL